MADHQDVDSAVPSQLAASKPSNKDMDLTPAKIISFRNFEIESATSSEAFTYSDLRPSLADKLRVGYFSTDRACQTQESDIIDLKETTALLSTLVQDTALVKKNLYYAKLALQADYDEKVERRSLELYNRTNERIAEIEKLHEERVKIVRHSFRTQLADAIRKISMDYHRYYGRKGQQLDMQHQEEIDKMAMLQEEQKKDQDAQQEMLELMQLQMSQGDDEEEEIESSGIPEISSDEERHYEEIRHLTDTISTLEDRVEEYMVLFERAKEEKLRAETNSEELLSQLAHEQNVISQLKRENLAAKLAIELEKKNCRTQLDKQKTVLHLGMLKDIEKAKIEAHKTAEKQIHYLQSTAKEKEKEMLKKVARQQEEMAKKTKKVDNTLLHEQLRTLRESEKQQKQEITRLQKELDRCGQTWEMRLTIQQQTMHALKDEMFLRTSLHRQAAKLQHAAITYASDGAIAVSAGVGPSKPPSASRKYQMGSLIGSRAHSGQGGIGPNETQELEAAFQKMDANTDQGKQSRISSSKYSAPVSSPTPTSRNVPQTQVQ